MADVIAAAVVLGAVGTGVAPDVAPALALEAVYEGPVYAGTNWWIQRLTTAHGYSGVGAEQRDLPRGLGVYVSDGPQYQDGIWWVYGEGHGWLRADDLGYEQYIPPPPPQAQPKPVIPTTQAQTPKPSVAPVVASGATVAPAPQPAREGGIHYTHYYCSYNGGVRGDGGGWCGHFANGEAVTPAHSGRVAACGSNWKLGDYAAGYRCVDRGHLAPNQIDVFYYYSSEAR